jgi:hypothetical protein
LAKSESNALGFLADEALEWYAHNAMVVGGLVNNDPTCFALGKLGTSTYPDAACLYMEAVRNDARRFRHASWLLGVVERAARARSLNRIQLWCRADLPANELWHHAGMIPIAVRNGGKGRDVGHICWVRPMSETPPTADVLSQRRRGRAGRPIALAAGVTADDVIAMCRSSPSALVQLATADVRPTIVVPRQLALFDATADTSRVFAK